jgi:hypothetical protein
MAEPVNSMTYPVPPFEGLGLALQQALGGQDVLDLARSDAKCERAERAVRRRMTVAAHDCLAGLREPTLRSNDVHDPVPAVAEWE